MKTNVDNLKVVLGRVFNFRLGRFCYVYCCMGQTSMATSRVENLALVSFCYLMFDHGTNIKVRQGQTFPDRQKLEFCIQYFIFFIT